MTQRLCREDIRRHPRQCTQMSQTKSRWGEPVGQATQLPSQTASKGEKLDEDAIDYKRLKRQRAHLIWILIQIIYL